jgi:hypothetical protein
MEVERGGACLRKGGREEEEDVSTDREFRRESPLSLFLLHANKQTDNRSRNAPDVVLLVHL